jgi:hypothetical protein
MLVGVREVPCVPAPERFLRRLDDDCARSFGLRQDLVHFLLRADIVREADIGRARLADRQAGIARETRARPERQLQAVHQVEERDRTVLEFLADDAFGFPAQAVAIEADGLFEVADAERDQGYPRFYGAP